MSYGLGKDTAIKLSLGKANYEALIDRHGQWVRWRMARKCSCVTANNRSDIHCLRCGGTGYVYDYQRTAILTIRLPAMNSTVTLPAALESAQIISAYDYKSNQLDCKKYGIHISLSGCRSISNGEIIELVAESQTVRNVKQSGVQRTYGSCHRIQELEYSDRTLEGAFYSVPADIVHIGQLVDSAGVYVVYTDVRQNTFRVESGYNGSLAAKEISYVPPYKWLIQSQDFEKSDERFLADINGSAIMTFPYYYDVGEGDVITVLSGSIIKKIVQSKSGEEYDLLPDYFVSGVISIVSNKRSYIDGIDYVLNGTNRLVWITEDLPSPGEFISINYKTSPTYRVGKGFPNLRTSENQRLPKKAGLVLDSNFSEAKGVGNQCQK